MTVVQEPDQFTTQTLAEPPSSWPGELDVVSVGEVVAVVLVAVAVRTLPALQSRPGRGTQLLLGGVQSGEAGGGRVVPGAGLVVDGQHRGRGQRVAGEGRAGQGQDQQEGEHQ